MKRVFYLLSVVVCLLSLAACNESVSVTAVELNKNELTLAEGASETLTAKVTPDNASDKTVTWVSSDTAVATVNGSGMVTAVAEGEATITATAADGSGHSDECLVRVGDGAITAIELNKATLGLILGNSETLEAIITPGYAADKTVTWASSDTAVATVDQNGEVTSVALGKATITATTNDGSSLSAKCAVSVVDDYLGTVSFRTDETWVVAGRTWSDAVTATRCQKEDYDGGSNVRGYKVDCRKSEATDYYGVDWKYGDLFSWKTVDTYGAILCPAPWRTPVAQDFIELDIALGGNGSNNEMLSGRIPRYQDEWGGELGGYAWFGKPDMTFENDVTVYQSATQYACYWSGESLTQYNAGSLHFGDARGYITPAGIGDKGMGFNLRCVK